MLSDQRRLGSIEFVFLIGSLSVYKKSYTSMQEIFGGGGDIQKCSHQLEVAPMGFHVLMGILSSFSIVCLCVCK